MAILKIARMGHPVLHRAADPVPDPTAPEIRRLVADMMETLADAGGIGLAAPQVHVPLRLFLWKSGAGQAMALINPELAPVGEETETGWEGCLSIPGLRGLVRRAVRLRFGGFDIQGERFEGEAQGLAARVMQHEYDHLDGVLYPAKLEHPSAFGFNEELARAAAEARARDGQGASP